MLDRRTLLKFFPLAALLERLYRAFSTKPAVVQPFVDNLLPDEDVIDVDTGRWIARRETMSIEEAERRFNLPPGFLRRSAATQRQARTPR